MKEKFNIDVFHIFENEWVYKKNIVMSIIQNKIGKTDDKIYARKCDIKIPSSKEYSEFLEKNHIQGKDRGSVKLGLYHSGELVSLMLINKPRFNKKYKWELVRFCNKLNTSVVGGFSKLLKHFKTHYTGSMITYADRRYSNGVVYEKNGFIHSHDSSPNYWYIEDKRHLSNRMKYQKNKLETLLEKYNSELSEWQNMQLNNYDRIWDCGNKVYILN